MQPSRSGDCGQPTDKSTHGDLVHASLWEPPLSLPALTSQAIINSCTPPSVASLEADAIELDMAPLVAEPSQEGRWLHLGRGHMTLMARNQVSSTS
jgi:hypothetical protein